MKKPALLMILISLPLAGCQLDLQPPPASSPVGSSPRTEAASIPGSLPLPATAASPPPASIPATQSAGTAPTRGILSDPTELSPGNPRSHAASPVERDLQTLTDKTIGDNETYRAIFNDHLRSKYPEYDFRIIDIMDYQNDGRTFRQARAYSAQSTDFILVLFYDGQRVFDSLERDIIGRRTTLNRWRFEFQGRLDPLSRQILPVAEANLDVSYDYYPETAARIRLDQPLDPTTDDYPRALELYYERPAGAPLAQSQIAASIFQLVHATGYRFTDYYLNLRRPDGTLQTFLIPPDLIGGPALTTELEQAIIQGNSPQIQPAVRPLP